MLYLNKNREISLQEWSSIFDNLELKQKLLSAHTVVVKPNLAAGTYADPKAHIMSDLKLLWSIIAYIGTANTGAKIYIAEADSTGNGFAYLKFERMGLPRSLELDEQVASRVECLDLTRDRLQMVEPKGLKFFSTVDKQLWLSDTLLNADFVVSLSNLKCHAVTGYTGACKNLFGCLPAFDKSVYHPHIHQVIHDVTVAIKPDLSIVDAFYGMERNGPVQGIDMDSGYRVFSNDPVEADDYSAASVGINPQMVKYLRLLHQTNNTTPNKYQGAITKYRKPQLFLRVMNAIGLFVQNVGQAIESFGHRIHSCPTLMVLLITLARPILVRVFDIDTLKKMKQKTIRK